MENNHETGKSQVMGFAQHTEYLKRNEDKLRKEQRDKDIPPLQPPILAQTSQQGEDKRLNTEQDALKMRSGVSIKPVGMHYTAEERIILGAAISKLREQGYSFIEAGERLRMAKNTARGYYREFRKKFYEDNLTDEKALLGEFFSSMERARVAHLAEFEESRKKSPTKTGDSSILARLAGIQAATFDRIQSTGLIPKAKEKIQFDGGTSIKLIIVEPKEPAKEEKKEEKV